MKKLYKKMNEKQQNKKRVTREGKQRERTIIIKYLLIKSYFLQPD